MIGIIDDNDDDDEQLALKEFCHDVPKIELHAHLNGCVRYETLEELAKERGVQLTLAQSIKSMTNNNSSCSRRSLSECFQVFVEISKCVNDLISLERITREALEDFQSHSVVYLELRSTPKCLLFDWRAKQQEQRATKQDYVNTIFRVFQEFQTTSSSSNMTPMMIPKFIMSVDRSKSIQEAQENIDLAIQLYQSNNPYIVGVEIGGNPWKNNVCDFLGLLEKARQVGLGVSLHCGEIPCQSTTTSDNNDDTNSETKTTLNRPLEELNAIFEFKPHRLGHALLLPKEIQTKLLTSNIPVECCPTSNVLTLELTTTTDNATIQQEEESDVIDKDDDDAALLWGLGRHPQLSKWLECHHPLSINTDDPGVFETNPTREHWLVARLLQQQQRTSRKRECFHDAKQRLSRIVYNSVDHAFCDSETKEKIKSMLFDPSKI